MGKKSSAETLSPLKPLRVSRPGIVYDKKPRNAEFGYEYDSLLTRSRMGGGPVRPLPVHKRDLERGERTEGQWQVVKALDGAICVLPHHALELVHLNGANFGFRWRDTSVERDEDVPPPTCMMGPHWHMMLVTWMVFCFLASVVNMLTFPKASLVEFGTGMLLSGTCLACYALVGCSDPGIVRRIEMPPDETYTFCDHCETYRPEGALHCMDCRVCIEEYDHHCPWTGKCVGKKNVRYFYAWLLFLVLAFVYEVIEFTTYVLPPESQSELLDSSDDSLEIIFPVSPGPHA
ncbi:hypothetical protein PHYBOEH_000901 [Phytophthora boehmeriae]|uniref:Palmitoyltransferase n=1 Tax=Phytophthora boehmeriae TaxID=109152 RepID=A0A8T1X029_9STRA|nr:hypothetical protein PHYBOEH_000901 [Phytophthora boehmeriae]